jgi:hypothetical protein
MTLIRLGRSFGGSVPKPSSSFFERRFNAEGEAVWSWRPDAALFENLIP